MILSSAPTKDKTAPQYPTPPKGLQRLETQGAHTGQSPFDTHPSCLLDTQAGQALRPTSFAQAQEQPYATHIRQR